MGVFLSKFSSQPLHNASSGLVTFPTWITNPHYSPYFVSIRGRGSRLGLYVGGRGSNGGSETGFGGKSFWRGTDQEVPPTPPVRYNGYFYKYFSKFEVFEQKHLLEVQKKWSDQHPEPEAESYPLLESMALTAIVTSAYVRSNGVQIVFLLQLL